MDCEGIAGLAVTKAAGTYDPARSQVTTYFSTAICNALTKAVQREYREARNTAIHATERDRVRTLAARDTRQLDQMQGAVDEALSSLPAKARLLIELRFKRRMSLRQIAEQSGRDARTIQGWMDDAMAALETLLRSDFGPP
jgi:RNA polymerase sigma factor (sigma-70 family)